MINNPLVYFSNQTVLLYILAGPFQGAAVYLNPRHSKRHIFGLYEDVLNPWLKSVLKDVNVVYDVGASNGYFTYGCAQAIKSQNKTAKIVSFEPGLAHGLPHLITPATLSQYSGIEFEFIPLLVGASCNETMTSLNKIYLERPQLQNQNTLIKVDVEGAELEVLEGASSLLEFPNHWVVEVHGNHLLEPVLSYFNKFNRKTEILYQKSHWLLGKEKRTIETSWVVTKNASC